MIRKWDIKNDQIRKKCIEEVIARVDEQSDETFGMIAAQDIIDIVAGYLGPQTYNSAIIDVKKLIQSKLSDIDIDLDTLRILD